MISRLRLQLEFAKIPKVETQNGGKKPTRDQLTARIEELEKKFELACSSSEEEKLRLQSCLNTYEMTIPPLEKIEKKWRESASKINEVPKIEWEGFSSSSNLEDSQSISHSSLQTSPLATICPSPELLEKLENSFKFRLIVEKKGYSDTFYVNEKDKYCFKLPL